MTQRRALGRRRFLAIAGALPFLIAGIIDTKALPVRKARFVETKTGVKMVVSLPDLLPSFDHDAMEALDSAFATRLVFELGLYRWEARVPSEVRHVEAKIFYDPWNLEYVVERNVDGRVLRRTFSERDAAVKDAVTLDVEIAKKSTLDRGRGNFYVVRIMAQRNPVDSPPPPRRGLGSARSTDLEVFSRWVGMFVRSRPDAEQTIEVRSNAFFLEEEELP